jgi:hypothetical protein
MEWVRKQGFDILPELIKVIINAAMQTERQQYNQNFTNTPILKRKFLILIL